MAESRSGNGIILLLDSDTVTRAVLRDALQDAGYLVATASDLGVAVDRLKEMPPDLLIVRPYINSMPGHLAADYLRSKQPGLPVLIVAGFPDDDRLNNRNEVEKFHTFPRPFRRDELLAKVRDVLDIVLRKG
ncbi:MAG: response regulator [Bryobacteraceae bacterium]|jgi:DNA-binding response OmpR family regulator